MTDERPRESKPSALARPHPAIRIVIYTVLAGLVVAAIFDFRSKKAFQTTERNVLAELDAHRNAKRDLHRSDLEGLISGRPSDSSVDAPDVNPYAATTVTTYTWRGVFREYRLVVHFGLPKRDPSVAHVERPQD